MNCSGGGNFLKNNKMIKPTPLAEVSSVQLPSVPVLVYSQAAAQSFPHLEEKTQTS